MNICSVFFVFFQFQANRRLFVAHWDFKSYDTKKLCFYYISALTTLSVRCGSDNEQGWCWGWSAAKVWSFGGSLRTSSCFEDRSKRRNGTEKHRRAEFSQDFHAPFHCKICMLSIRHTSQGDQDFFFPSCPWCCFDNTAHFKHAFHMWVHLTIPLWCFMHTMATEPWGFKWRVSLGGRVAVNYYSQFERG